MTDLPPLNERISTKAGEVAKLLREGPAPGTTAEDFLRDLGLAMHHWAAEARKLIFSLDEIADDAREQARAAVASTRRAMIPRARSAIEAVAMVNHEMDQIVRRKAR